MVSTIREHEDREEQSPANQVWGIGHIRETVLDDCAELYQSPLERTKFFRRCISNLDRASIREFARHTHTSVLLDEFPFDCPDEVRRRWYTLGVKRLNLQGALPMCHRWTLAELLDYFPNVEEIQFPSDSVGGRLTTLYRSGHPECCVPGVHNFITSMRLSLADIPADRFVPPEDLEHVHYCDFAVVMYDPESVGIVGSFDLDDGGPPPQMTDMNLMTAMLNQELPGIMMHPIRRLDLVGSWNPQMWINIFNLRRQFDLTTLHFSTGDDPESSAYFAHIRDALGPYLRSLRTIDRDFDLTANFNVFTANGYPALEELHLTIEPRGGADSPLTEPLPPNLKNVNIDILVYTFTLNQPASAGLFPEDRLPLDSLRRLQDHAGPECKITARVVTNMSTDRPRLQAMVDEALGVRA